MKSLRSLAAAFLAATLASTAMAQPPEGRPREQGGEPGRERPREGGPGGERGGEGMRPGGGRPGMPGGMGGNPGEMMGRMLRMMPVMKALDVDEDGLLSASEIENASKALLKLDRDGDGKLSMEELRPDPSTMPGGGMMAGRGGPGGPGGVGGGPEMIAAMFEQRDANKDGKLSGDEIPERMRERVNMIDENSDGAIDKAEMGKAMARMGDRAGARPGGAGDEGGGVRPRRPQPEN